MKTIRMAGGDAGLEIFSPDGRKAAVSRTRQGDRDVLTIRLDYAGAYGMGEKFNGLNQKGKTSVNQVVEKFCHQGHYTYLPAPFFRDGCRDRALCGYEKGDGVFLRG